MKFEIHHLLGIDSGEVDIGPGEIVEVVGPNASGKTSFAVIVQALAGRNANPLGLSIGDARKTYLHRGDEDGYGRLTFNDLDSADAESALLAVEQVEWVPRNATMSAPTAGESAKPLSRPEAVGLVDFVGRQSDKARAAMLQPVLLPPPAEVLGALKNLLKGKLLEQDLLGVLKSVQDRGWSKTEAVYTDRSRVAKRSWAAITGRNYGASVASDWLPDGWLADYDGKTVLEAEGEVAAARDALALLHKAQAVAEVKEEIISKQQQFEAKEAKAALPDLRVKVADADEISSANFMLYSEAKELEEAQCKVLQNMELDLKGEQPRLAPQTEACPNCATHLMVQNGLIVPFDLAAFNKAEATRTATRACIVENITKVRAELNVLAEKTLACKEADTTAANEFKNLKQSIDDLTQKAGISGEVIDVAERMRRDETKRLRDEENSRGLAEAEQDLHDKESVIKVVSDAKEASDLQDTITRYSIIAGAIGPRGVRNKMLEKGLGNLNAGLDHLSNVAGWPAVAVDAKGVVMIHGTHMTLPSVMCSESEKWRAQAMIQLTVGVLSDSRVVMIDRADMLDKDAWSGLVKAVGVATENKPMSVLLCSTGELAEDAPWRQVAIKRGRYETTNRNNKRACGSNRAVRRSENQCPQSGHGVGIHNAQNPLLLRRPGLHPGPPLRHAGRTCNP